MSKVFDIFSDDTFSIKAEVEGGAVFIHCYVHKGGASVIKKIKECWVVAKEEFLKEGIDFLFCYTNNLRFTSLIDDTYVKLDMGDSIDWEVLRWELS